MDCTKQLQFHLTSCDIDSHIYTILIVDFHQHDGHRSCWITHFAHVASDNLPAVDHNLTPLPSRRSMIMMDFFKNCKSNVQVTEKLKELPCRVYAGDTHGRAEAALAELRGKGVLCAAERQGLWVFGPMTDTISAQLASDESGWRLDRQEAPLASLTLEAEFAGYHVSDILFRAIQGAVSASLHQACGAVRLGHLTWMVGDGRGERAMMLRLHLDLTEAGSLYATTTVEASRLTLATESDESDGSQVVLAPSGCQAQLIGDRTELKPAIWAESWTAATVATLRTEGLAIEDERKWLPVRVQSNGQTHCFFWPAKLCFALARRGGVGKLGRTGNEWRQYFAGSDEPSGFCSPLRDAEQWFKGVEERAKASTGIDEGQAAPTEELNPPTSEIMNVVGAAEVSAPFNQRTADQQAAMAGIYPTPEDNLVPPGLASQQPSSDNVFATAADQTQDTSTAIGTNRMSGVDGQARDQSSSSDPAAFPQNTDDLFGDMGGMDFGGDEVGDADFDFFNEQDELSAPPPGPTMTDTEMSELMDTSTVEPVEPEAQQPVPESERMADADAQDADLADLNASEPAIQTTPVEQAEHQFRQNEPEPELVTRPPDRPLSPFGIKERLFPPPVPASAVQNQSPSQEHRRSSRFDPLKFREGPNLARKYSAFALDAAPRPFATGVPDIGLPSKRKRLRERREAGWDVHGEVDAEESDSEEESRDADSSESDVIELPPRLPWERKRKRTDVDASEQWWLGDSGSVELVQDSEAGEEEMRELLDSVVHAKKVDVASKGNFGSTVAAKNSDELPSIEELYVGVAKLDLVYIAQLVGEQAVSCIPAIQKLVSLFTYDEDSPPLAAAMVRNLMDSLLHRLLPDLNNCSLPSLALTREPPPRTGPQPLSRPGQPRPQPQRTETMNLGPDIMSLPPPYVRVRRGNEDYEMLPPALNFWEPLSLAPPNGPKHVRAYCVLPLNEDLQRLMDHFLSDLGAAYESCKLGSHSHIRNVDEENELDDYEDGMVPVHVGEDGESGVKGALQAFHATCNELGLFLASVGHVEPERTIVVYVLDVFSMSDEDVRVKQHLCACFWQLYKAYRDHVPKAHRAQPRSDIVLQLLPLSLVASPDTVVTLDAAQIAALAKEVYDRCPPVPKATKDAPSALPNFAALSIELASQPPKRINFQLAAEPPSDLLHEGSSLHVAYAISGDGKWMTVAWVDSMGKHQSCESFCLRGRSLAETAGEAWERTREIIAAREVTWRLFVVTVGEVEESVRLCWRKTIETPRRQPFSVTLLSAQVDPDLQVIPPMPADDGDGKGVGPGAGFLTPATTPQGTTMTVSPDTSTALNAPPTPAPSDSAAAIVENDAEAHLVDLTDESWAMLCSAAYPRKINPTAVASGALFKRGEASVDPGQPRPHLLSLALDVLWTVQVRPNGNVDEGNVKQSEMTLREVLRLYRNLSVLTKARGITSAAEETASPVHLVAALRGAKDLDGLLS